MITLMIKKEMYENWISFTGFKTCHFRITANILKWYYTKKGYQVEEIKDGRFKWRTTTCFRQNKVIY